MISMTTYWQQFKDSLDQLSPDVKNTMDETLINTANGMVDIGLTIESMGITAIGQVSSNLHELSKNFENSLSFSHKDKEYRFNLPRITDRASLLFAIVYYQHLSNYQYVEYQGEINWGRRFVIKSVNAKKETTHIQAQAMLEQIRLYCHTNNIILGNLKLLKQTDESISDYVKRLSDELPLQSTPETPLSKLSQPNVTEQCEQALLRLAEREQQTITKINNLMIKLTSFTEASQHYHQLQQRWQNQGTLTKLFQWLTSWFHTHSLSKDIQAAKRNVDETDNALRLDLDTQASASSYLLTLYKQVELIRDERNSIQFQLEKSKVEQSSQLVAVPPVPTEPCIQESDIDDSIVSQQVSAGITDICGFFKQNMPSQQTVQVVAVGLAAIAVRNLNGC